MKFKLIIFFGLSLILNVGSFSPSSIAIAGTRRCKGIIDTVYCVDEKGDRTECYSSVDGSTTVCTGKNSYRKECKDTRGNNGFVCNDNRGVKIVCENLTDGSTICQNSKGYRTVCRSYGDRVSVCTDVDRKGKPI
jgi:hypothetical protein